MAIYPRVHHLRMKQMENGFDISYLRLENCGLAVIHFTHHISKLFEGKTESYRVRACRTCTKLTIPLDLGQYADLESAMIVNDVHEILQGRTTQLHVLIPEDIAYLHYLNVRKRGGTKDIPVMVALEERARKNNANPRLNLNLNLNLAVAQPIPSVAVESHNFCFARNVSAVYSQDYLLANSPDTTMSIPEQHLKFGSDIGSDTTESATDMSEAFDLFETLSDEDILMLKSTSNLFEFSENFQSMDYCFSVKDSEVRTFDELFTW